MRYILSVVAFVLVFDGFWIGLVLAQRGLYTSESFGTCSAIARKSLMVRTAPSPKLVIVGGSGVTMGVSAAMIEKALGIHAVNFGTMAGLGPAYMLAKIKPLVGAGDTVLLALEYQHYYYDKPVDVLSDTILACDAAYFWQVDARQKRLLLFSVSPWRLMSAVRFDAAKFEKEPLPSLTLLPTGDIDPAYFKLRPVTVEMRQRIRERRAIQIRVDRTADGARAIQEFIEWAGRRGVRVLATWPATLQFAEYSSGAGFAQVEAFYRGLGVPVLGSPFIAMFDADYFYNSNYHLNERGIALRTEKLIPVLSEALPGPDRLVQATRHIRRLGGTQP